MTHQSANPLRRLIRPLATIGLLLIVLGAVQWSISAESPLPLPDPQPPDAADEYVVLSWNDLGMHCYNPDFQDLAVLPPYNNLWAQVIRVGDPPQLVTDGVNVTYGFADNTYSVGKSNFWEYDEALFGVDLPPNVGLTGKGMAGDMDPEDGYFLAEGIPLTEFSDSDLINPDPYQVATVIVYDAASGDELARTHPVAPVSTELHCDNCHYDGGVEGIATGRVETNILTLHDMEHGDEYPPGHEGPLMDRRPILCAECHASNALAAPGVPEVDNLSKVIHAKHDEEVSNTLEGCYNCHPGPETECLRDVMATEHNMDCVDCHGGMQDVAENPEPWLNEPRCDTCHDAAGYEQNQDLYRQSTAHGDIYCAACHDSPHAIAPSREPDDWIKFLELQGHNGTLDTCTVCHATQPQTGGPHGVTPDEQLAQLGTYLVPQGSGVGGDLFSLLVADDNRLLIQSVPNGAGTQQQIRLVAAAYAPVTQVNGLNLTVEVSASRGGTRGALWLYNFDQNRWDKLGEINVPQQDVLRLTPDIPSPNRYVRNSDGLIGVQLTGSADSPPQPTSYTLRFDLLQVRIAP